MTESCDESSLKAGLVRFLVRISAKFFCGDIRQLNAFVLNQLTDEVVSVFYMFSTFVGDRVAGQCECPLIVTSQQNRRVHRHQTEECEQREALQIDCFLCSQSQRETYAASQELSATHPCFLDVQETTLPERLR